MQFVVVAKDGHPLHPAGLILSEWPSEQTAIQAAEADEHAEHLTVKSKPEADMDRHYRPFVRLLGSKKKIRIKPKMTIKPKDTR